MDNNQQLQQYVKRNVDGANQGELILLLYDAGINSMNMGKARLRKGDIEGAHNALIRAILVLDELISSLNMEKGGEIAKNLLSLYMYMKRRLIDSNMTKDAAGIDEALFVMDGLREAWRQVISKGGEKGSYGSAETSGDMEERKDALEQQQGPAMKPLNISV